MHTEVTAAVDDARLAGPRSGWDRVRRVAPWPDLLASWLVARGVVGVALLLVHYVQQEVQARAGVHLRTVSLLGWDAAWYDRIAISGYDAQPTDALRFFPLVPLLARGVGTLLGGHPGLALLLLANVSALGYAALLHRLALAEGLGEAAARRVLWIAALAPAGFVLVMGYAEATYGLLVTGAFLALRSRRWTVAAALGLLAGTARPTGVLLALPAAIEGLRGLRLAAVRELLGRAVAVLAPITGLAGYLLWSQLHEGDWRLPFTVQTGVGLRGGLLFDTRHELGFALRALPGHVAATTLHLPWIPVALALLVVAARRLPASYPVFATATLVLALTAKELSSFERYTFGAVPLLLAAALVCGGQLRWRAVLTVAPALLGAYATLAFLGLYTP